MTGFRESGLPRHLVPLEPSCRASKRGHFWFQFRPPGVRLRKRNTQYKSSSLFVPRRIATTLAGCTRDVSKVDADGLSFLLEYKAVTTFFCFVLVRASFRTRTNKIKFATLIRPRLRKLENKKWECSAGRRDKTSVYNRISTTRLVHRARLSGTKNRES